MTVRAGILNVTGYVGAELVRLLHGHPHVEIAAVTGRSAAGKRLSDVYPHLWQVDLPIVEQLPDGIDVVVCGYLLELFLRFADPADPTLDRTPAAAVLRALTTRTAPACP